MPNEKESRDYRPLVPCSKGALVGIVLGFVGTSAGVYSAMLSHQALEEARNGSRDVGIIARVGEQTALNTKSIAELGQVQARNAELLRELQTETARASRETAEMTKHNSDHLARLVKIVERDARNPEVKGSLAELISDTAQVARKPTRLEYRAATGDEMQQIFKDTR